MLILTSFLWGSSFPIIKIIITTVNEYFYVGFRSLIAVFGFSPYVFYMFIRKKFSLENIKGGLFAGIVYALGLWLQGWGTRYTLASNSAFITGLSVIFVHLYTGLIIRKYSVKLGMSLILSIIGLYMITVPSTGFNVGDFLVLLGSFMWALQIILVDKYCHGDPIIFTFFEMVPALTFLIPYVASDNWIYSTIDFGILFLFIYLAIICSDVAFALQVVGQRYINPAVTAVVFLLEPVFAAFLAYILISEVMNILQIIGGIIILLAILTATYKKV